MDYNSFKQSIVELRKNLFFYALNLTADETKAEDLTQETMLKALAYREKFRENNNLKAWLCTIMKNTFINDYRKNVRRINIFEATDNDFEHKVYQHRSHLSPDSLFSASEIYLKINCLKTEYRIPFVMFIDGYKYKEISEKLNIPIGTVKNRIFLTRKLLCQQLPEYHEEYLQS